MSYWQNADVVNLNTDETFQNLPSQNNFQEQLSYNNDNYNFDKKDYGIETKSYRETNQTQSNYINDQLQFQTTRETENNYSNYYDKIQDRDVEYRQRTRTHTQIRRKTIEEKNRSKSRSNTPDKQVSNLNYKDKQKMNEILTPDIIEYKLVEIEEEIQQDNKKPKKQIVDIQETIQFRPTNKTSRIQKEDQVYQFNYLKQNDDQNKKTQENQIDDYYQPEKDEQSNMYQNYHYNIQETNVNYQDEINKKFNFQNQQSIQNENKIQDNEITKQKNQNDLFDYKLAFNKKTSFKENSNQVFQQKNKQNYGNQDVSIFEQKNKLLKQEFKLTQTSQKQNIQENQTQTSLRFKMQNKNTQTLQTETQNNKKKPSLRKQHVMQYQKFANLNQNQKQNEIQDFFKFFEFKKKEGTYIVNQKTTELQRKKTINPIQFKQKPFIYSYIYKIKKKDSTKELMDQYYQNKINQYKQMINQNKLHFNLDNALIDKDENDYFIIKRKQQIIEQTQTIENTNDKYQQDQNENFYHQSYYDSYPHDKQQWTNLIPSQRNFQKVQEVYQNQHQANMMTKSTFQQQTNKQANFETFSQQNISDNTNRNINDRMNQNNINIKIKKRIIPEKFVKVVHDNIELILKNYGEIYRTRSQKFIENLNSAQKSNSKNIFQNTTETIKEQKIQNDSFDQTQYKQMPSFHDQNTTKKQNFQNTYKISDLDNLISHQYSNKNFSKNLSQKSFTLKDQKPQSSINNRFQKDIQSYVHPISDQNIKKDNFINDFMQKGQKKSNEFFLQKIFEKYDNVQVLRPDQDDSILSGFQIKQRIIDQLLKQNGKFDQVSLYILNQNKNEFLIVDDNRQTKSKLIKFSIVPINGKNSSLFQKSNLKRLKQKFVLFKKYCRIKRSKKNLFNNQISQLKKRFGGRISTYEQFKKIDKSFYQILKKLRKLRMEFHKFCWLIY